MVILIQENRNARNKIPGISILTLTMDMCKFSISYLCTKDQVIQELPEFHPAEKKAERQAPCLHRAPGWP